MLEELKAKLEVLKDEIVKAKKIFNEEKIRKEIKELETEAAKPNFWNDQAHARKISQELAEKIKEVELWAKLEKDATDYLALTDIVHPGKDPQEFKELEKDAEELEKIFNKANIKLLLNGKFDASNAIVSFHAGAGGTDSQDFAEMLMKMYLKYAENHDYKTTILETSYGEEAGIKSATVLIEGFYAYGYLKNEHGVHRLVRLSPFNAGSTRETSFALVEVVPEIPADHKMEIDKDDLRIDTFRSSGPGGQSVNTTDSAVRITHIPTGIMVRCQNERSQLQNKEQAMKILKGKLIKMQHEMQAETLEELRGKHKEVAWGNQIRSYVLHPYKMIKDHRTDYEEGNVESVLNGNLDEFIEARLLQTRKEIS